MKKGTVVTAQREIVDYIGPEAYTRGATVPMGTRGIVEGVIVFEDHVEYDVAFEGFAGIWICTKEEIQCVKQK